MSSGFENWWKQRAGQAIAKWCKHCICWRFTQSWMPRATLKLTPQLKPSKNYTSRSNHYMQLHAESSQSSFVYHSSGNLSSLLGKLNCGKCWLSSWFSKFNSGNKLCKSATCNLSFVFSLLKKGRSGSCTIEHYWWRSKTQKNLENVFTCREMLMLAMLTVVVQLETEDWINHEHNAHDNEERWGWCWCWWWGWWGW